tara:strand:- start:1936 stop:2925 length:990 start_codon:yes stop_codon:yes gene_type:complete
MNDFTNQENTNLIWQLINEFVQTNHKVKINENNLPGLSQFFVNTVNDINSKRFEYDNNIMILNKEVLSRTAIYINQNIRINQVSQQQPQQLFNSNNIKLEYERKKDMSEGINKSLQSHKDNFQSYQVKQPTNIDFSDKSQEFETNRNFNDTLAQREAELKRITSEYNATDAKKWIENSGANSGENEKDKEPNKRKVSFNIREITENSKVNRASQINNTSTNDAVNENIKENKVIDSILKNSSTSSNTKVPGEKTYINPTNFFNKLKMKKAEDEENNINSLTSQVNTLKSLVETLKNNQNVIMQKLDKLKLNMNGNSISVDNQDEATALA